MLTRLDFWVGVIVAIVAMWAYHKYQSQQGGS